MFNQTSFTVTEPINFNHATEKNIINAHGSIYKMNRKVTD